MKPADSRSAWLASSRQRTRAFHVSIELKAGYVIDLSEPGAPAPKIVGGVAEVIDAKPVEPNAD